MKILIAEDDPAARLILQAATAHAGHQVLVAQDGEQAWRIFQSTPGIEVVISDWMMPRLDGLGLCERVRTASQQSEKYTYYILLTARDGDDDVLRGIQVGADEYLTKPIHRAQLEARLQSAARIIEVHRRSVEKNDTLEAVNALLREQSRRDPLTGLGNRLRLDEDLDSLRDRSERYGHRYCLVLCDLDRFKAYNDRYGHQAGDEALRRVGQVLAQTCRPGDTAYRYGGEELLVVLSEQSLAGGIAFAERLRRSVRDLGISHDANVPARVLTLSLGVAALDRARARRGPEEVLAAADAALYRAKANGRNSVFADDDGSGQ